MIDDDPSDSLPEWEDALNRWFDDDLAEDDLAALNRQSSADPALAAALVEVAELRRLFVELPPDHAPVTLRRQLLEIPQKEQPRWRSFYSLPRWQIAFAVLPLLAIGLLWLPSGSPSQAEIDRGQRELAVALAYLQRAGHRSSGALGASIHKGMALPVLGAVSRSLEKPLTLNKEAEL